MNKLTTQQEYYIMSAIRALPLRAFSNYFVTQLSLAIDRRHAEWLKSDEYTSAAIAARSEAARKNSLRRSKERDREQRSRLRAKTLKSGDIVKMKGTRDKHGYRQVVQVADGQVVCRQLRTHWTMDRSMIMDRSMKPYIMLPWKGRSTGFDLRQDVTTHADDKLVMVFKIGRAPSLDPAVWVIKSVDHI